MSELMEQWVVMGRHSSRYSVSDRGRVRNNQTGVIRKHALNHSGYPAVTFAVAGNKKTYLVHALVTFYFLGPKPTGKNVNHKNGVKADNRPSNLEYTTPRENTLHGFTLGLMPLGETHGNAKLNEKAVCEIRTRRAGGEKCGALAKTYGVCQQLITQVCAREIWKHVG